MEQNNYNIPPPTQMYYPPDFVPPEEKKKIRRGYNIMGIFLLASELLAILIARPVLSFLLPEMQYDENGYAIYTAAENFAAGIAALSINVILFAVYCLVSKCSPKEFFGTKNISAGQTARYIMIVIFMQQLSAMISYITTNVLGAAGLYVPSLNFTFEHTPLSYAAEVIGAVLLAPIGEELLYRGIVLRCASKVSQRFAIFFSAFIFGIAHGNPYQFILGFLCGIPMAMITVKTGSLIPSIICHIANNTVATVPTVIEYFSKEAAWTASDVILPVFLIVGLAFLIAEFASGGMKLPPYTSYHKKRTLPILITSWSSVLMIIFYVIDLLTSVVPIPEEAAGPPEMVEQAARIIFRL